MQLRQNVDFEVSGIKIARPELVVLDAAAGMIASMQSKAVDSLGILSGYGHHAHVKNVNHVKICKFLASDSGQEPKLVEESPFMERRIIVGLSCEYGLNPLLLGRVQRQELLHGDVEGAFPVFSPAI
jgi:hypothetical protein